MSWNSGLRSVLQASSCVSYKTQETAFCNVCVMVITIKQKLQYLELQNYLEHTLECGVMLEKIMFTNMYFEILNALSC